MLEPTNGGLTVNAIGETCDVLVVEDDLVLGEQLVDLLESEGYRVHAVPHGRAALDYVARNRVNLVVLDLMLPVLSGWEFLAEIRNSPEHAQMPVFIITAVTNLHRAEGGPVFLKPLNITSLLRAVRARLGPRP